MTALNKQALREAAEKSISEEGETWWNEEQLASEYGLALHRADAKFIAAANPDTVLAMLDELEVAEKRIAELEAKIETADKLQDSAFRHGIQHGFSYGQTNDQEGYEKCLAAYSNVEE